MEPNLGLKILLVEDNADIREGLVALLEGEGYLITPAATAEEGLALLAQGTFHLVVTDYMLPKGSGAWMLDEASEAGHLHGAQALIITAHPKVASPQGVKVIHKPLDIDDFLRVVYELLAPARAAELDRTRRSLQAALGDGDPKATRPLCELRLYISSNSPASFRALKNLQRLLSGYDPSQVRLTVLNLTNDGIHDAEEDRIMFTPTLVRRTPAPRAWVLGDLNNAQIVSDLLTLAGVEPKK